jgi:hypothetical protein
MIYVLVNNNYQLIDLNYHLLSMQSAGLDCALITVPHTLNQKDFGSHFSQIYSFPSPVISRGWLTAWPRYYKAAWDVWRKLKPGPDDSLFIYSEFELLNHLVAHRFHSGGAKVFLLEDGGVGTYLPFSAREGEPLGVKQWLVSRTIRCLPHLGSTIFRKVNGVMYPWLKDDIITALCMYRYVNIVRSIPILLLEPNQRLNVRPVIGRVIFLNEPLYDHYLGWDKYLIYLGLILRGLSDGYEEVWFKFHPREGDKQRQRIMIFIESNFSSIKFVQENENVESLLGAYRPESVASFFATTLLNLNGTGIEPLFVYHLCPDLAKQDIFGQLTHLLSGWNYCFAESFQGLRSGYQSGWNVNGQSPRGLLISEVVQSHSVNISDK